MIPVLQTQKSLSMMDQLIALCLWWHNMAEVHGGAIPFSRGNKKRKELGSTVPFKSHVPNDQMTYLHSVQALKSLSTSKQHQNSNTWDTGTFEPLTLIHITATAVLVSSSAL